MLGAEKVIAIDKVSERLRMAEEQSDALPLNYEEVDVQETLKDLTGGRGPDACIDAVGLEANGHHRHPLQYGYDRLKQTVMAESDRPIALREAIVACRNGGTVSVPGVYGGLIDKLPFGSLMNRSITVKTGQTHVQRYMQPLLDKVQKGDIDPSFVITHRLPLEEAPEAFKIFSAKEDECIKVVLTP